MGDHVTKNKWKKAHEEGCVTKCRSGQSAYSNSGDVHAYRSNGHVAAKTKAKNIYDVDFTLASHKKRLDAIWGGRYHEIAHGTGMRRQVADPRIKSDAWHLETGRNFQKGYLPYNHDSHHLIPCGALNEVFAGSELILLMQATYNVNLGGNVIMLPKNEKIGQALKLPIHYSSHGQYSVFVMTHLQSIRFAIAEEKDKHAITDANKTQVKDEIVALESELWTLLIELGESAALATGAADLEQFDKLMMSA